MKFCSAGQIIDRQTNSTQTSIGCFEVPINIAVSLSNLCIWTRYQCPLS